jgi:hypothetical protein
LKIAPNIAEKCDFFNKKILLSNAGDFGNMLEWKEREHELDDVVSLQSP